MYSVTSFRTDAAGIVYTCDWTYSNADGSVRGVVSLEAPVDNIIPVGDLTPEIVTGWVVDVLPNTSKEFDAHIAADKARREAEEAAVTYTVTEDGTYSV
jgi:hypothetical protein